MCIDCDPGYLPNVDGTMCEGIVQFFIHNYEMTVSAQTLMSVQAIMVDVIRCVPTLMGALSVLVILDTS